MSSKDEEDAKQRLISLLGYCKELSKLNSKDATPVLELAGDVGREEGAVLHEAALRRLQELKQANGDPVVWLAADDPLASSRDGDSAVWMRLHRPDVDEARRTPIGQQCCAVYASLFSAHQEALREGRGAQVTVGVGQVRWKVDSNTSIDHPLVTLPAVRLHSDSNKRSGR